MSSTTNPYKDDVDFAALALQDADFAKVLKSNGQLDFSDPISVQQLTKSLLKRDFGLKLSLPDDRLCPPVPNRLNYILWIQSLLDTTDESYSDKYDPSREVVGIDIGTGASCIYPLLGCSQRPNWKFIGTDIDSKSMQYAKQNVQANNLQDRIKLILTKPDSFLSSIPFDDMQIDFTMCNPPFYSSTEDMLASATTKQRPPFTACTGSANEMVTAGGEVAFVSRMIDESLVIREGCQWYTSMLGKFSSIAPIVERLRKEGVRNWAVTEFVQGTRTRRWAVAWSFGGLRPSMGVSRGVGSLQKGLLPFPSECVAVYPEVDSAKIGGHINEILSSLPLKWMWKASLNTGLGFSETAVWSRAARRQASHTHDKSTQNLQGEVAFGFKILVDMDSESGSKLCIRWVKGNDSVIFESFCGMLKRKLEEMNGRN